MNSTKPHAYPRYDEICNILEYGAHIGKTFPVSFCQNLLEQLETCAQQAQSLPQVEEKLLEARMMIGEMIEHFKMPHLNKEARKALIKRAERILNHDANESAADGRAEAAE